DGHGTRFLEWDDLTERRLMALHLHLARRTFPGPAGDRLAQQPAEELESVTAHVERHAAARTLHVPEPRRVRPVVLLGLLDEVGPAQRPLVEEPLQPHVLRR